MFPLPRNFHPDENIFRIGRAFFVKAITAPVEVLHLLRFFCVNPGHKPNHFAPGHLCINTLLDDLSAFRLTKNTGDISVFRLQVLLELLSPAFQDDKAPRRPSA